MKSEDIFRIILTRMWGDEKFNRLSSPPPNGKYLWIYLVSGPFSNRVGLFKAGEMTLAEELGWDLKGFREAFGEAFREGLVKTSPEYSQDRLIFIPNFVKINFPASPNVIINWKKEWNIIPECSLKLEAWHHIKSVLESRDKESKAWSKAFIEACRKPSVKASLKPFIKPYPLPSPIQEQEQEQEKEKDPPTVPQGGSGQEFPAVISIPEPKEPKPKKRTWPFDDGYQMTAEMRQYALEHGVFDPEDEFMAWKLYCLQHAPKYVDWNAAWQTRCRNYHKFSGNGSGKGEEKSWAEMTQRERDQYHRERESSFYRPHR